MGKTNRRLEKAGALRDALVALKVLKESHVVNGKRLEKVLKKIDSKLKGGDAKEGVDKAKELGRVIGKLERSDSCSGKVWPHWLAPLSLDMKDEQLEKVKRACKKRSRSNSTDSNGSGPTQPAPKKKKKSKKKKGLQSEEGALEEERKQPYGDKPVVKDGVTLLLFYAYVEPDWDEFTHKRVLSWAQETLTRCGVTGRLRVAKEGFNGTLTGPYDGVRDFCEAVRKFDPENFCDVDFKLTDGLPEGQRFPKLNVFVVSELVNYGLAKDKAPSIEKHGGVHLEPKKFHEKLKEPNTVVIDVRNSYEAAIGRFAPPKGGADYVDPKMRLSTEFPDWIDKNLDRLKEKQVLMFCTGGVRCERASALLKSKGHEKGVYQLGGGIHKYLEEFAADGGHWVGKNYTFDKRFAHGAPGVEGTEKDKVVGNCASCKQPWDKYRGRKRCPQCAVPLLICGDCQKKKAHETALCHLCEEDKANGKIFTKRGDAAGPTGVGVRRQARQAKVNACGKCEQVFKSRNALFKHLQESGHQTRNAKKQRQQQPYCEQDFCG